MNLSLRNWKIPAPVKIVTLYYLLYCFLFVLFHLSFVSIFSFFHFLLDHDMNTIEDWLNRNSWEILALSKISAIFVATKITKLNSYNLIKYRTYFLKLNWIPSKKIFGVILFLLTIFYAFIIQFGGGLVQNQFKEDLFYSSFIGSFTFYIVDFMMIYILLRNYDIPKKYYNKIMYITLIFFLISSKIALPYLNKFYIFLMIHFITMIFLTKKDKISDVFVYAVFIIAPLSSVYGLDIVWDNAYSLLSYQKSLPVIGILGIWGVALGYYHYSRAD